MNRPISSRISLTVVVLSFFTVPAGIAADPAAEGVSVSIQRIDVGFAGLYQVGRWTRLSAAVETDGPATLQLSITVPDPEGSLVTFPSEKFELISAGFHRLSTQFKSGRLDSDIEVNVTRDGKPVASKTLQASSTDHSLQPALKQSEAIWATLGNPVGFGDSEFSSTFDLKASAYESVSIAYLNNSEELPQQMKVYDGLNSLLFNGQFNLDDKQNQAVRDWVRAGGHLVLATGRHYTDFLNSPLASWIPVTVGEAKTMRPRDISELELFSETNYRVPFSRNLIAAKLSTTEGAVSIAGLDAPLLVRVPYGFGKITVFALDLNQDSPLKKWKPISAVCRKMVADQTNAANQTTKGERRQLSHSGITDLATQLHAIQEHFPLQQRFSANQILWMILAYLVIIGPVDYLIVHRLFRKPQLTWFTFPLMVTIAVLVTISSASNANSNRLQVNQFDVIDIDEKTGFVRSQSWLNIFSPNNERYKVTAKPEAITPKNAPEAPLGENFAAEPSLVWSGIPETVFGGMYRLGGFDLGRPAYRFGDTAAIENLPIATRSTKPLTATWNYETSSLVESNFSSSGFSQLTGSMTHKLPVPIEDWIIAYGNRVFRPRVEKNAEFGRIAPNEPWNPNTEMVHQRELKGFLRRAKFYKVAKTDGYGEDILVQQDKYNPLDLNPTDLMRMITFHQASGGTIYSGLENFAMANFDFSRMLDLDRAVLFGRVDLSASSIQLDEKPVDTSQHVAFVRILFPVKQVKSGPRVLPDLSKKRKVLQHLKQDEAKKKNKAPQETQ